MKTIRPSLKRTGLALAAAFALAAGCNATHLVGLADAGAKDVAPSLTGDAHAPGDASDTDGLAEHAADAAPREAGGDADAAADVPGPDAVADRPADSGTQADGAPPADADDLSSQVTCTCLDSAQFTFCGSSCAPSDLQQTCPGKCASHGGIGATDCVMRTLKCAPLRSALELVCLCGDGTEARTCTTTECASPANIAAGCAGLCTGHGAATQTSCGASSRCAGSSRLNCFCNDTAGKQPIGVCTASECTTGAGDDVVCDSVCATLGGLWGTGCMADDVACQ